MERKRKQENYQSKLTRATHNFHHAGGNGLNAYGRNNHGNGDLISKRHAGISTFSSYAKSYGHISYDDYGGYDRNNAKYDYYEHSPYDCKLYTMGTRILKLHRRWQEIIPNSLAPHEIFEEQKKLNERVRIFDQEKWEKHIRAKRVDECHFNIANYVSYVLGIEDKGRNMEKELGNSLEDLPCLGEFVENVGYVSSSLDAFIENHNDFVSLNQLMSFVSGQAEFSCNEQKLSNAINSLDTLFQNTFGFQFYHLHLKEHVLKDFENQMQANLELFKVNPLAFENSNLKKEAFERICNYLVVEHLYYHKPFKDWFSKLFILSASFQKNSCAFILKHEYEDTLFIHLIFKEFFDKVVSKEKCRPSWDVGNFMFIFSHLILCNNIGEKRCVYVKENHALTLEGKTKTEFVNALHSKNLGVIQDNNKKLERCHSSSTRRLRLGSTGIRTMSFFNTSLSLMAMAKGFANS
ncbi:hypothetical protein M9H77_06889 [Catharanthus roseus]|uniref:Uncharacterized protein n=1 Tax=Catharanthus roseus TaxID=4058 RepID=A0ACC0BTK2_CATRO|nr:hypothetical protein M9H77_06889 [Catharanthus roseus]